MKLDKKQILRKTYTLSQKNKKKNIYKYLEFFLQQKKYLEFIPMNQ